jgi:hypothetical protein
MQTNDGSIVAFSNATGKPLMRYVAQAIGAKIGM